MKRGGLAAVAASVLVASCGSHSDGVAVPIPDGASGIGFDDLRYSNRLHRVLAPAGRTGALALIAPDTLETTTIAGFQGSSSYSGGHDDGPTSVDDGAGFLFVTDRTSGLLHAVDPATKAIVATVMLGSAPDYVRYVRATNEVWVSEPSAARIEIFAWNATGAPALAASGAISVADGPESLVIDQTAGRAYTHRWQASTVVLDVTTRTVVAEWPNGCAGSRGLAVDEARGFFFAGCLEGTISVLDAAHDGRVLSSLARGAGYDVIGYNPTLGHVYVAGSACACLVILGVSSTGELSFLGRFGAASGTHCAAADDRGHAWVCDPDGGQLWRVDDPYPASL